MSERNIAYRRGNLVLFKKLKNKVNHLRNNLKKDFYFKQTNSLKANNPNRWWKTIKSLCGITSNKSYTVFFSNMYCYNQPIDPASLANVINNFFVSCTDNVPNFDTERLDELRIEITSDKYLMSLLFLSIVFSGLYQD